MHNRPGRKRSEDSRLAILVAAFSMVGEVGYAKLTIEGIAARAGVGKQTIYRWWPTKADVLLDALAAKADLYIPIPDNGSYAADLRAFLEASFALGDDGRVITVLRALMAQAQLDEDFSTRFRDAFLLRRRAALGEILDRAAVRGELPPAISPDTTADIIFGVIWYRVLTTGIPAAGNLAAELVAALT